jgi:hypothetical protein
MLTWNASVDSDMDNKSNLVPAGASQAAGHRGRHRRQPCLPRAGGGCGYDSHGFPAQHCYAPLLGVCALVLYAGPQAPAASLLATAHGRLLLARTSRAHCWSKYSGHKPPNPNPSHQWSLHISRSLLNQASLNSGDTGVENFKYRHCRSPPPPPNTTSRQRPTSILRLS